LTGNIEGDEIHGFPLGASQNPKFLGAAEIHIRAIVGTVGRGKAGFRELLQIQVKEEKSLVSQSIESIIVQRNMAKNWLIKGKVFSRLKEVANGNLLFVNTLALTSSSIIKDMSLRKNRKIQLIIGISRIELSRSFVSQIAGLDLIVIDSGSSSEMGIIFSFWIEVIIEGNGKI